VQSNLAEDAEPLPTDEFTEARVGIFPFAHIVRAGSRLRLSVHTPGGDRARWTYILADHPDDATVEVGHDPDAPSRLVLPVVTGIGGYPPSPPADCRALRAQPCRDAVPYTNRPGGS
jgi:predicted acyl esterase